MKFEPRAAKLDLGLNAYFRPRLNSSASPENLSDYMLALREELNRFVSPNTDYVVHQIRNVIYWTCAEHVGLSYSPMYFV
jgi:hypothetical protein